MNFILVLHKPTLITLSKNTNALVADDTTLYDDLISSGVFHNINLLWSVTK